MDFQEYDILCWLAELMKHRDADTGRRYKMLASRFIEKYQISTEGYDVIKGWRANASYFYIAKCFVRERDKNAREAMYALINSEKNKIENVFSKLL